MTEPAGNVSPVASRSWSVDEASALDRWRQGHVLQGVPAVSIGHPHAAPVWSTSQRAESAGIPLLVESPVSDRRALVVSQGCDLVKITFPWATVVPVYNASTTVPASQAGQIRTGQMWHLVHLTAGWAADGLWVADLRLEMPIDKTVLVAAGEPIEGFADETGYARLAERLAAARQRPAVPQPCIDHIVRPLQALMAQRREQGVDPLDGVREVRLQPDDPTTPTVVTLFVLGVTGRTPDVDEWSTLTDSLIEQAGLHGLVLVGPDVTSLDQMSAADYLTSQPIEAAHSS